MTTRMPFGKFRGHRLQDLPADYLQWLCGLDLQEPLRAKVFAELHEREAGGGISIRVAAPDVPIFREIIDRGVRAAAKVHHPDVGGDARVMVRLNGVSNAIRTQLAAIGARL